MGVASSMFHIRHDLAASGGAIGVARQPQRLKGFSNRFDGVVEVAPCVAGHTPPCVAGESA
jgi:hypothetical protein